MGNLELYQSCTITEAGSRQSSVISATILARRSLYDFVQLSTAVPWYVVACLHSLESSLRTDRHLHNGDPLTARTIHVPKGRPLAPPASGVFPYTWRESACDAIQGFYYRPAKWDMGGCLDFLEHWNGLAYRKCGVNTPYLWSMTNQYAAGKFVSDDRFDPKAVSQECGAAAIIKQLELTGKLA